MSRDRMVKRLRPTLPEAVGRAMQRKDPTAGPGSVAATEGIAPSRADSLDPGHGRATEDGRSPGLRVIDPRPRLPGFPVAPPAPSKKRGQKDGRGPRRSQLRAQPGI